MKKLFAILALAGFAQAGKLVKFPSAMGVTADSGVEFQIHANDRIVLGQSRPGSLKLVAGDTVQVDTTSYLLSRGQKRRVVGQMMNDSILLALSQKQNAYQTQLLVLNDSLDKKWQRIHRTDSMAFFQLHKYYTKSDSLLGESLALNRHLIRQSYLATGMIGAVGGGLVGAGFEGSQPTSTILYSIGGAALGVAINRIFLKGAP